MPGRLRRLAQASVLVAAMPALIACDGGSAESEHSVPDQHVWQDEVDTIDKARGVEDTLNNAAQARQAQTP